MSVEAGGGVELAEMTRWEVAKSSQVMSSYWMLLWESANQLPWLDIDIVDIRQKPSLYFESTQACSIYLGISK